MAKEVVITRDQIIVVDTVSSNQWDDLIFTDKEGNEYKVGNKRVQYFDGVIVSGVAVQLNYAVSHDNEYIYNAVQVKGELPPPKDPIKPELQEDEPTLEQLEATTTGKPNVVSSTKFQVDARTHDIHRQVALKVAAELVCHGMAKLSDLKSTSEMLLTYLDGE